MIKILHTSDVHIYNDKRHDEYKIQFEKLYNIVKEEEIDIVCIVGDLFENFIEISHEAKLLAAEFLNNITKYSYVVIVPGNHDIRKKDLKRKNSIETIVNLINNSKITYFDKSGFFKDKWFDKIVWVNHSHLEKQINPWKDIKHKKDKSKIYIDLFHDPIKGCTNDVGYRFDKLGLKSINDFKGDISMFGDLHKFQLPSTNKGYPSSLLQQNYGESIINHGFLIWYIDEKNITYKFYELKNEEFAYATFKVNQNTNYDELNLISTEDISYIKNVFARVIWNDYSSVENKENENKIKNYLNKNYSNISKLEIDRDLIYNDVVESKLLSETIDINNEETQKAIIKEYLELNKFDEDIINEILNIDEIINDRLNLNKTSNITWNIEKIWFNNFKSYGENNEINFNELNGIIQIHGANQQGKTTILDAICYALYGTTISTQKREKYGDNRYINNLNGANFCDAGVIINVNGEKYLIYRKTEKEIKKNVLKGITTKLDYFRGEEMIEENRITGENRIETQEMLDSILGNFSDFLRLTLTNADNLNQLLSMDRAEFVDSITKDAGFNIFELKLEEFKDYRKQLNLEKINLDIKEENIKISNFKVQINDYQNQLKEIDKMINNLQFNKTEKLKEKDILIKRINKIEEIDFDLEIVKLNLEKYEDTFTKNNCLIDEYIKECMNLPTEFDYEYNTKLTNKFKEVNDAYNQNILKEKDLQNEISNINNQILNINNKIDNIKQSEQSSLDSQIMRFRYEIKSIDEKLSNLYTDRKKEIYNEVKEINFEIKNINKEISNIKEEGIKVKKEIEIFKSSNDTCPTCKRPLVTDEDFEHINEKLVVKNKELKIYYEKGKDKMSLLKEKEDYLKSLNVKIDMIEKGDYDFDELKETINNLNSKKNDFNKNILVIQNKILDLQSVVYENDEIKELNKKKFSYIEKTKELKLSIENDKKSTDELLIKKNKISDRLQQLEIVKSDFEREKELNSLKEKLILQNKNIESEKSKLKESIEKHKKNLRFIEENNKLKNEIDNIEVLIEEIESTIKENIDDKISVNNDLTLNKRLLEELEERIDKYNKLQKIEYLHTTYQNIMNRNGIPTFLIKKSIHIINNEISKLLSNVDFNLYFDNELNLKMNKKEFEYSEMNAYEGSGMERTFCAVVLKTALRKINTNPRPSLILYDEIIGKLVNGSVDKFIEFLDKLKYQVDKVLVIEHVHEIMPDYVISVSKNSEGISSFKIE